MTEDRISSILARLSNLEERIKVLETSEEKVPKEVGLSGAKQKTLREIVRGKKFSNASEKIAAIVGYHEQINGALLNKHGLRKEWLEAKFDGTYRSNLFDDACGVYIREKQDGNCDLTQTGEDFFNKLQNEPIKTAFN